VGAWFAVCQCFSGPHNEGWLVLEINHWIIPSKAPWQFRRHRSTFTQTYIHTYICVNVHINICLHNYMYIHTMICIYLYINSYLHAYIYVYIYTYMYKNIIYVHIHLHKHLYILHIYMCTYIHMNMSVYIHMLKRIQSSTPVSYRRLRIEVLRSTEYLCFSSLAGNRNAWPRLSQPTWPSMALPNLNPLSFDGLQLWRSVSVCSSLCLLTLARCAQCSPLIPL